MTDKTSHTLSELDFETTIGGQGELDESLVIPLIDMSDFEHRKDVIADELWQAAVEVGFFQLVNHAIPVEYINKAFSESKAFFDLSKSVKQKYALVKELNAGWEYRAQVRPSTGTADEKESWQYTLPNMAGLWPSEAELPDFRNIIEDFEQKAWALNMQVLSCFARKLGFDENFFADRHRRTDPDYQSTLRLLHYLPVDPNSVEDGIWRAGAHTDFDCLTLLFQRAGQSGLQVSPGRNSTDRQIWTSVEPIDGVITCNIGDMLKRWSDDKLLSTLHRVRMPTEHDVVGSRYSIAFFAQANKNQIIQGPEQKYPAITANDFLQQRIKANFSKSIS